MTTQTLVGRCGLYCGACSIYRAQRDNQEYRSGLALRFNCPPEKVRCNGCGALTPECWGYKCKLVKCLKEKGYEFCFECPEYEQRTCEMFEKFSSSYLKEDGVDLRKNFEMIKAGKIDKWLKLSEEFYTCKFCAKPTVAGAKSCHHCKKESNLKAQRRIECVSAELNNILTQTKVCGYQEKTIICKT